MLLGVFWSAVFVIYFGARWGLLPEAVRIGDHGVLRFAVDSLEYQRQAAELAAATAAHGLGAIFDGEYFAYARLMALLYVVVYADPLTGMIFNAVFYVASLGSVFILVRTLLDERTAVVATWLSGLWPGFLLHEVQTLRWVATTAGVHLALMGMTRVLASSPSPSSMAAVLIGFLLLVFDLPWTAQLIAGAMLLAAAIAIVPATWTPALRARALALTLLALTTVPMYRALWPATPAPVAEDHEEVPMATGADRDGSGAAADVPWWRSEGGVVDSVRRRFDAQVVRVVDMRDRAIADALAAAERRGQYANSEQGAGTALLGARDSVRTAGDLLRNLPRAYASAFTEPTPAQLLGGHAGMSNIRPYVLAEMALYYLLLPFAAIGVVVRLATRGRGRGPTLFVVFFAIAVYALLGTIVMNAGTLYRLRLPYVQVQCGFAVAGIYWAAWRLSTMRRPVGTGTGIVP